MKNQITIGGRIGYLRPITGRYDFAEITGIDTDKNELNMSKTIKQGKFHVFKNTWNEKIEDVIKYYVNNKKALVDSKKEKYWAPVDMYVGGSEHATRHLIYARFWHKFLYDIKAVSTSEPFARIGKNLGLIRNSIAHLQACPGCRS